MTREVEARLAQERDVRAERKADEAYTVEREDYVDEMRGEAADELTAEGQVRDKREWYSYEKPVFVPELADDKSAVFSGTPHDHPGYIPAGVPVQLTAAQDRKIREHLAERWPHQFLAPGDPLAEVQSEFSKSRQLSSEQAAKSAKATGEAAKTSKT